MHIFATATQPKLLFGLTPAQKKIAIQSAEQRRISAKQLIVRTGDPAANLFLLIQGTIKYYRETKTGEEVLLWWLVKEDCFGIGALLGVPQNYIATAQAIEDCELLVWNRENIRSLAARYKVISQNALHIVLYALAAHTDRLIGLATGTAEQRLAHTLLQLSRQAGIVRPNGVELTILNEHVARMANVSPFTASRQLQDWERRGIIKKSRGKIVIVAPEALLFD